MADGRDDAEDAVGGDEHPAEDAVGGEKHATGGDNQTSHGDQTEAEAWSTGQSETSGQTAPESGQDTDTATTPGAGAGSRTDPEQYITDRRSLSPRIQVLWAIRAGITALVLGLIVGFALAGLDRDPRLGSVVALAVMALGAVWVVLYYRIWVYQIRDDAIYLERGVVTHVRTLVPYVRIQHVDTSRGPVERLLGLSTLVVYTAGSRGADVSIPGLTPAEATDLQQRVKRLAIEAEGDDAL
jgi:membrane protein YdbS with pleckstrin-like domain